MDSTKIKLFTIYNGNRHCNNISIVTHFFTVIDCGAPPLYPNMATNFTNSKYNDEAIYECHPGYELASGNQDVSVSCQADKMWQDVMETCQGYFRLF